LIERKRVASAVGTALILTFVESVTATRAAIISVTSFVEGHTRGRGAISVGQNLVLSVSEISGPAMAAINGHVAIPTVQIVSVYATFARAYPKLCIVTPVVEYAFVVFRRDSVSPAVETSRELPSIKLCNTVVLKQALEVMDVQRLDIFCRCRHYHEKYDEAQEPHSPRSQWQVARCTDVF
jgi:hypothetical protein